MHYCIVLAAMTSLSQMGVLLCNIVIVIVIIISSEKDKCLE